MAKKWTSFLKEGTAKDSQNELEKPSLDFEEILKENEGIKNLFKEKEELEQALKNASATQGKEVDPRFRESEIIPISKKKKQEKKWSQKRDTLAKKKREKKKEEARWEKKRTEKTKVSRAKKKGANDPIRKNTAVQKRTKRSHKKNTKNETAQWLEDRGAALKVFQEEKQQVQKWLANRERQLLRSKEQLRKEKERTEKWLQKQEYLRH